MFLYKHLVDMKQAPLVQHAINQFMSRHQTWDDYVLYLCLEYSAQLSAKDVWVYKRLYKKMHTPVELVSKDFPIYIHKANLEKYLSKFQSKYEEFAIKSAKVLWNGDLEAVVTVYKIRFIKSIQ